ncbi:MAG: hypothetical protein ABIH65_01575 [Nanoarchaeota archaeon]
MKLFVPQKIIHRTDRHIRWNWEVSPENSNKVRYHFIVVDDKKRDMTMNSLIEQISSIGIIHSPITKIRQREGKVKDSDMFYLFHTYDSRILLKRFSGTKKLVRRDFDLKERVRGSIEKYVERMYSD